MTHRSAAAAQREDAGVAVRDVLLPVVAGVSMVAVGDPDIRASVLRQGLVSFLFLTIIIAISIDVIAGLGPG